MNETEETTAAPGTQGAEIRRTTRRAMLSAGLGALVGLVAQAVGRPPSTQAANGDAVVAGQVNSATQTTTILNGVNATTVFGAQSATGIGIYGGTESGFGVQGQANQAGIGVRGISTAGNGVLGTSDSRNGVEGRSNTAKGVYGYSNSGPGVYAYSSSGIAVWGYSDSRNDSAGVYGQAAHANSAGVLGFNLETQAEGDLGTRLYGVLGRVPNAIGMVAVRAEGPEAATALDVEGKARFSRSGRAVIGAGRSYVDVSVPQGVDGDSLVLANLLVNRPGVYVQSAVPNPATGRFRIYLNKVASSASSTPVAWFVIN